MLSLSWDMYVSFPGAMLVGVMWGLSSALYSLLEISLTWSLLTPAQMLLKPDLFPPQILDPTASGGCSLFTLWPLFCGHQISPSKWPTTIFISTMGISLTLLPQQKSESESLPFLHLSPLSYIHTESLCPSNSSIQWALTSKSVHVSEKFLWIRHLFTCLRMRRAGVCVCVAISTLQWEGCQAYHSFPLSPPFWI